MTKRKKRRNQKGFVFVLLLVLFIVGYNFIKQDYSSEKYYSDESIKIINENNLTYLYKTDYSKTLDEVLKSNNYSLKYVEEYLKIDYINNDYFCEYINDYLNIGYKGDEINDILKLSKLNQDKIRKLDKKNIKKYINIKNFNVDNIDRYENFENDNSYTLNDIITYVNIGLDQKFYTNTKMVDDPNSLLVLVNKYNYLPDNYKPNDVVYIDGAYGNQVPIRKVLKDSFEELQKKAKEEININLMPTTAFRNHSFQTTLYNNYVASDGQEGADAYSARPGYSEHQTGLAIDLKNMALTKVRLTDDNYKWLENNAYKYGFIIRYPKDKEKITGYQFENWHIRYVGTETAKIIHDNNLTLEEYIDLYITEY